MALEDIANWLHEIQTEEDLNIRLLDLLEASGPKVSQIQIALSKELDSEDGDRLAKQLIWLDAQHHFIGSLQADADALLDLADKFFLSPPGRSVECTTEDGRLIPATGCKVKVGHDDFMPKFKELTDVDRNTYTAAKCVAFRRLRNEYKVMAKAIEGRMWLGKMILGELVSRNRASGLV